MRNKSKIIALVLALMMLLSACGSDYPVMDRKLDVEALIEKCFEGTGMEIDIEDGNIIVDSVADIMVVDMDKSEKAIKKIQTAIKNASVSGDGLTGAWMGTLDISPIICEIFSDVEGLNLESYLNGTYVPATLTFTENGMYMLKFDEEALKKANDDILKKTSKATKAYIETQTTGAEKLVASAIPTSMIEDVLVYAIRMGDEMLENGASGSYVAKNGRIIFDGSDSVSYILNGNILQIGDAKTTGVLSSLGAAQTETFTKA